MYAMVCTRPETTHAVGVLRIYMSKPGKENWIVVKRVFKYLRGTTDYAICYQVRPGLDKVISVHGFFDADWDGDLIAEDLQVGMCSTYLEELSIG